LQEIGDSMGSDAIGFWLLNDYEVKIHFLVHMAVFKQ